MTNYKLIYFTQYGNVIAKTYPTATEAWTAHDALTATWKKVVKYQDTQNITDQTHP
jgi:hypothetical protein